MGTSTFKRILCPYDFTAPSVEGLEMALSLTRVYGAELYVLHVIVTPPGYVMAQGNYVQGILEDEARLTPRMASQREPEIAADISKLGGDDLQVKIAVEEGLHEDLVIREHAELVDADLIVMASHGRRGLARFFLGSTTERVLRGAPCPVLIVRPREITKRDRLTDGSEDPDREAGSPRSG